MVERKKKTRSPNSSAPDPATQYALDVTEGRIIAGPDIRNACKRHLNDLAEGESRGLYWDVDAVARVVDFFAKVLKLNGGEHEGAPFVLLGWQAFVVGSLFGWKKQTARVDSERHISNQEKAPASRHYPQGLASTVWLQTKSRALKSMQPPRKRPGDDLVS